MVAQKKKDKENAKVRAAEEAHKRAEEQKRREQAAREQKEHEAHRTVDFAELYGNMVPDVKAVQTDASLEFTDHWADKRHSKYWRDRVTDESHLINDELRYGLAEQHERESEHNPHHFKTTDLESEYDGMLLQTGFVDHWNGGHHSKYWKDRINDEAKRVNADWRQTFAQAEAD